MDLWLKFHVALDVEGIMVRDRRAIARSYRKGNFGPDLLLALPLEFFCLIDPASEGCTNLRRALWVLKLGRARRASQIHEQWRTSLLFKASMLDMCRAACYLFSTIHFMVSIFLLIGMVGIQNLGGWVAANDLVGRSEVTLWLFAVEWVIETVTTVGYGHSGAYSESNRTFAIFAGMTGAFMFSYILSMVIHLYREASEETIQKRMQMDTLVKYCEAKELPPELTLRLKRYMLQRQCLGFCSPMQGGHMRGARGDHVKKTTGPKVDFINELSTSLRSEVDVYVNRHVLESVELLDSVPKHVCGKLVELIHRTVYSPGEYVMVEAEPCKNRSLFIIADGSVSLQRGEDVVGTLTKNSTFGELEFLDLVSTNQLSVRAETYCDIRALRQDDFKKLASKAPDLRMRVVLRAKEMLEESGQLGLLPETSRGLLITLQKSLETMKDAKDGLIMRRRKSSVGGGTLAAQSSVLRRQGTAGVDSVVGSVPGGDRGQAPGGSDGALRDSQGESHTGSPLLPGAVPAWGPSLFQLRQMEETMQELQSVLASLERNAALLSQDRPLQREAETDSPENGGVDKYGGPLSMSFRNLIVPTYDIETARGGPGPRIVSKNAGAESVRAMNFNSPGGGGLGGSYALVASQLENHVDARLCDADLSYYKMIVESVHVLTDADLRILERAAFDELSNRFLKWRANPH
uniref:Cyclic nucleotide-binding domain-containing protein n=1 Tax=Chromera velia CCMP2878 TaxID=1169474 RepID=A0A0G4GGK3_9ALVE|eukprot:Cvel_21735.t1-p1 / transcript=Cvel_21735.t1 / gene=Cvel_21735 / organism=Chromera_velia_CCMP2878 / gene_product=Potassium channel AKT2, putative / transcript_product=Potassium channel AKT2, putative / location=Cvel_scaffold2064:12739-17872(-) / protein_length=689 / sequence_SO=supercontig / SO=protein_coding / is_pseudo=false